MNIITGSAKQQAIGLAKQIAKDISEEPEKIAQETKEQLTGIESTPETGEKPQEEQIQIDENKIHQQGQRQLQALESEIKDIQMQKEKEKVMEKRQEEQQQFVMQRQQSELVQPSSKPSRRFGAQQKAKQQQTRIEKPLPPTG